MDWSSLCWSASSWRRSRKSAYISTSRVSIRLLGCRARLTAVMFGRHYTQSWSRLLGIVQQICRRFDADARTATGMVAAGLDVLDGLSRIFKQVTKGITWDPSTSYEQVHLSSSGSSVL